VTRKTIHEYAEALRPRYLAADKQTKGAMLREFCATAQYHPKAAIRLLRQPGRKAVGHQGRKPMYGRVVAEPLKKVWEAANGICSKRLVPFLPELVANMERHNELQVEPAIRSLLVGISASTMDRLLKPYKMPSRRRPYTQSQSVNAIKAQVPIRTFGTWQGEGPGAMQADLVMHCGESPQGFFLCSLLAVDIKTGWIGLKAIWGKGQDRVCAGMENIRRELPFLWRKLHTDNGGEFLNGVLYPWCQRQSIESSRGRPYKKNDQAYAEQKNWSIVRQLVGNDRYSNKAAFLQMQELYRLECLYANFFQPVSKLLRTERVGAKVKKFYDRAQTPYQRLLATGILDETRKNSLERLYQSLNLVKLRAKIYAAQNALWQLTDKAVVHRPVEEPAPELYAEDVVQYA
jgi:hypothetical protein